MLTPSALSRENCCVKLPVLCGPRRLVNAQPHGLSELSDLKASPLHGSHKSWDARSVVQALCSWGRAWCWGFPPNCKVLRWGVNDMSVSQLFLCFNIGIFSVTCYVGGSQLFYKFFLEGIIQMYLFGTSLVGGEVRYLFFCHLANVSLKSFI